MKWEEGEDGGWGRGGELEDEAGDVCSAQRARLTNGWSVMVLAAAFQGGRKQARRVSQTSAANAQVRARIAGVVYVCKLSGCAGFHLYLRLHSCHLGDVASNKFFSIYTYSSYPRINKHPVAASLARKA